MSRRSLLTRASFFAHQVVLSKLPGFVTYSVLNMSGRRTSWGSREREGGANLHLNEALCYYVKQQHVGTH